MALGAQGFADGAAPRSPPTAGRCARCCRASGCSRSTRSTCSRARTTCRSSAGSARTTPAMLDRAACARAAAAVRVLGPRGVAAAGRAAAAAALADGRARTTTPGAACGASPTEQPELVERVLDDVRERGPVSAARARAPRAPRARPGRGGTGRDVKRALEWLFWSGEVTSARRRGFERLYDLPERVLPRAVLAAPTPTDAEAQRELRAHRRARARRRDRARPARLLPAAGRRRARRASPSSSRPASCCRSRSRAGATPAYLRPGRAACRAASTRARCVGPFDSLVWERPRVERLFGFRYRIEIYVPGAQARARLLRAAVPARRPARRARRPQGRPRRPACCSCRPRTPSRGAPAAHGRGAGGASSQLHGRLARARRRVGASTAGDLAPALRPALASVA